MSKAQRIQTLVALTRFGSESTPRNLAVRQAAFAELEQLDSVQARAVALRRQRMGLASLAARGFKKIGDAVVWRGAER